MFEVTRDKFTCDAFSSCLVYIQTPPHLRFVRSRRKQLNPLIADAASSCLSLKCVSLTSTIEALHVSMSVARASLAPYFTGLFGLERATA